MDLQAIHLARVLEQLADFLPVDFPATQVIAHVLLPGTFDRASGQVLLAVDANGVGCVLTRPSDFELFRALPCSAKMPFEIAQLGAQSHLKVRVFDRSLMMTVTDEDAARVEALRRISLPVKKERKRTSSTKLTAAKRSDPRAEPPSSPQEVPAVKQEVVRKATSSAPKLPVRLAPPSPPPSRESPRPPMTDSVHPPAFHADPLPVVNGAHDIEALRRRLVHYWDRGDLDESSQVARVLVFLDVANNVEKRLAALQSDVVAPLSKTISPLRFKAYVTHEDEDVDLGRLLTALWPPLLAMRLRPEREMGLRPHHEVDFAHPSPGVTTLFHQTTKALGLPLPRLWIRDDVSGGLAHLNVSPVGSLCGKTLISRFTEAETLFVIAHHLSFYRPEAYVLALLPSPADLLGLACAGLHLERMMPRDPKIVEVATSLERFMVPPVRNALRDACSSLRLAGDPRTAIASALVAHRRAAHFTAARAGLLLTGAIHVAAKMMRYMPPQAGITLQETIDDLVRFAVSPAWFNLRRELGLALPSSSPGTPLPQ